MLQVRPLTSQLTKTFYQGLVNTALSLFSVCFLTEGPTHTALSLSVRRTFGVEVMLCFNKYVLILGQQFSTWGDFALCGTFVQTRNILDCHILG